MKRGVLPGNAEDARPHHLHLWLAGEVLRVDLGPGLVGQPVWLLADRLTRQQLLVHRKVTKILELTVTHPGIVM